MLLAPLRHLESQSKYETAQRTKQICGRVFRYGIASGYCSRDPSADLAGALVTPRTQHRAAITNPREVGALLRAIEGYQGNFATVCALRLAPLLFVRPGELRAAEWQEIDLDAAEWRIPAEKMKMGSAHIVPLAAQAITVLRELQPLTGHGRFLFPGQRSAKRPMSENTINAALRYMGYDKATMSAHGFRAMASTLLNELGYKPDVIERQLAHVERNKVRAAYNRASYLEERRQMMQQWADYLDNLKRSDNLVAFRHSEMSS
jgi:integrase